MTRAATVLLVLTGCVHVPDQSRVMRIDDLARSGEPFVRLYAAPIPGLQLIAIHTWLVTKRRTDAIVHRWEVWGTKAGPFAHVRRDLMAPETHVGAGHTFLIGATSRPRDDYFTLMRGPVYVTSVKNSANFSIGSS